MPVQKVVEVEFGKWFPHGAAVVSAVTEVRDFEASTRERPVQARDRVSGLPLWSVQVIDFDPEAGGAQFSVTIAAPVQPVPPAAIGGTPLRPVVLDGLRVTPRIVEGKRRPDGTRGSSIGWALFASGMSAPGKVVGDASKVA